MQLWLARHAEAEGIDSASSDAGRQLTETGRRQMAQIGRWIKSCERLPELILHSPLVRARQTAEILQSELGHAIPVEMDHLLAPGLQAERLLARLSQRTDDCVLCVGHQPDIGRCLSEMLGGGCFAVAPGTIACVEFPQISALGGGQLRWLLAPGWFG